jgi:hypothetical protein
MTVTLRRVHPEADKAVFSAAWLWIQEQRERYAEIRGIDSFGEFLDCGPDDLAFAIEAAEDSRLLAFAGLTWKAKGCCEFILIAPARPRLRPIIAALQILQRAYFDELGFYYLFTSWPDDDLREGARKLARLMGWREVRPNYFEFTLVDHLNGLQTVK